MTDENGLLVAVHFLILMLLVRISVTDLTERKIGKRETCLLVILALVRSDGMIRSLTGGLVCAAVVESINYCVSRLKGLGGGDIRLIFVSGCLLGIVKGFCALLIGGICALTAAAGYYCRKNREPAGFAAVKLPFAPFLSLGIAVILIADMVKG